MFLEHDWLVKHNPEVNWKKDIIWFTRCSRSCRTSHQKITFKAQTIDIQDKKQQEIGKEPDPANLEDLLEYIQLFTYLFNKKNFEKLLEWQEWDHKINLTKEVPKELNAKTYTITIKKDKALNQWLDE